MPALPRRFLLLLCLALPLAACNRGDPGQAAGAATEVRVYEVPPAQTEALAEALNEVMDAGEDAAAIGHASSRIPGQLVVRAPAAVHASVAQSLEALTRASPAGEETARTLRIWRVDVRPGPDEGLERMSGQEAALDALRERFPGQGLVLADELSLAVPVALGRSELSTGRGSAVSLQTLPGDLPTFDVYFQSRTPAESSLAKFESRLTLPPGETLVAATLYGSEGTEAEGASVLLMRLEEMAP